MITSSRFRFIARARAFCVLALLSSVASVSCQERRATVAGDGGPDEGTFGDGGELLRTFTPPVDPGPGGVLFAASGELAALTGFRFPPNPADSPAFIDGWEIQYTRLLVTFDNVRLANNPDVDPGNQALTGSPPGKVGGGIVAEANGPWAVDLAHAGSQAIEGKGDPGVKAVPLAALSQQNRNGGKSFATDGTRYGFSFDVIAARAGAYDVNLDEAAQVDYAAMVAEGCSVLYVGTATFKGGTVPGYESCNAGHDAWPAPGEPVSFHLCFKSPTSYLNCQNADLTGLPLGGDEAQRGIPLSSSQSTLAQLTLHTDHPFWDSMLHDAPAHFDAYAGRILGRAPGARTVTLDDLVGVDFGAVRDAQGQLLTWRTCLEAPTDVHARFVGPMSFDRQTVPRAVGGDPATGLRDLADYVTYNQSTQGHLNADGLCAIQRNYPSPP